MLTWIRGDKPSGVIQTPDLSGEVSKETTRPTALGSAQYVRRDHGPNPFILLEAVASQDLWIWHAFFGVVGSNNDINVLYQSPLFNDLKTGRAPEIPFVANGVTYRSGYYLVNGIYPELAPLVKMIPELANDDHKRILFKQKEESARKDVERAFGVLKKKWAILANPTRALKKERIINMMYACIILHNMIRICDISKMVPRGNASTGRPVTKRGTSATRYALDQISTSTSKPST
ncbi:ALP1-like protein [Tanacetum coccineum]